MSVATRTRSARGKTTEPNAATLATESRARSAADKVADNDLIAKLINTRPIDKFAAAMNGTPKYIWKPVLIGLIEDQQPTFYMHLLDKHINEIPTDVFNQLAISNEHLTFPGLNQQAVKMYMAAITRGNATWNAHLQKVMNAKAPNDNYVLALIKNGFFNYIGQLVEIKELSGPMVRAWVRHVWIPSLPVINGKRAFVSSDNIIDVVLYGFEPSYANHPPRHKNLAAWLDGVDEALPYWKFEVVTENGAWIQRLAIVIYHAFKNKRTALLAKLAAHFNLNEKSPLGKRFCLYLIKLGFPDSNSGDIDKYELRYSIVMWLTHYCKIDLVKMTSYGTDKTENIVYKAIEFNDKDLMRILAITGVFKNIGDCVMTYAEMYAKMLKGDPELANLLTFSRRSDRIKRKIVRPGLYAPGRAPKTSPLLRAEEERKRRWTAIN
jgi:hypothetical protein